MAIGNYRSFNSFNPSARFAAQGLGLIYDSLMVSAADEVATSYGLLAECVDVADDRSSVTFVLRDEAYWNDAAKTPVTAEDVAFTYDILTREGHPFYVGQFFRGVEKVEVLGPREVRFVFDEEGRNNRELAFNVGSMSVLPKHYWQGRDFSASSLDEVPLGSGPYRIKPDGYSSRHVTYSRVESYWGKNLPVNVGQSNFDIRFEYFGDLDVARAGFFGGNLDLWEEYQSKAWATAYDVPAVKDGDIIKTEVKERTPQGMQAFVYNTRRDVFDDPAVREAVAYLFNFEWTNDKLFYNAYKRTDSYFESSSMEAEGKPSAAELKLLEPFADILPKEVFTQDYIAPDTDGRARYRNKYCKAYLNWADGRDGLNPRDAEWRCNKAIAIALLEEAGWHYKNGKLINADGKQMDFTILLVQAGFLRIVNPFADALRDIGVNVRVQRVEPSQYQERVRVYNYDMIVNSWGVSQLPGVEQMRYWHSSVADEPDMQNYAGIKNPAVDALVEKIVQAKSLDELRTAARALDRALLWGHYVIPHWYINAHRLAYWDMFERPENEALSFEGYHFPGWWLKESARN